MVFDGNDTLDPAVPQDSRSPLLEVSQRFSYQVPLELTLSWASKFAECLGTGFLLEALEVLEAPPGLAMELPVSFTFPGFRLSNSSNGNSVSLQNNLLAVRWKSGAGSEYGNFDQLFELTKSSIKMLGELSDGTARPLVANMAYVSRLHSVPDLGSILSESYIPVALTEGKTVQEYSIGLLQEEGVDLRLDLKSIDGAPSSGPRAYRLATGGGRVLDEGEDPLKALQRIHAKMRDFFDTVIKREVRDNWK